MMRLLARLHGLSAQDLPTKEPSARTSIAVGAVAALVVLAHLATLGAAGAVLLLSEGAGFGTGEKIFLIALSVVALVAFGRAIRVFAARPQRSKGK